MAVSLFHFQYSLTGLCDFGASLLSITTGLVVLLRSPRSNVHRSLFLFTVAASVWLFTYAALQSSTSDAAAYWWLRACYLAGAPFIPPSFFLFTILLTQRTEQMSRVKWSFGLALVPAILMFLFAEDISGMQMRSTGRLNTFRHTLAGTGFVVVCLGYFITVATLSAINLYKAMKKARIREERIQLRNVLIGLIIGYVATEDFLVAWGLPIPFMGFAFYSAFILFVAYAIVRYRFLAVNVMVQKGTLMSLIYVGLLAVLIPFSAVVLSDTRLLSDTSALIAFVILTLATATTLSTGPLIYAFLTRRSFWFRSHSAAGVTHELKSPLATIQAASDLIIEEAEAGRADPDRWKEYAGLVRKNTERLSQFANDLLILARVENDAIDLERRTFNVSDLVAEVVESYRPLAEAKGLTIQTEIANDLATNGDASKLRQVISNVLSNALRYTSKGTVIVTAKREEAHAAICVSDDGMGIDQRDLDRVFDRFYQARGSSKGSGIGLTIAKAWVEAHGGRIWAESDGEGKGTTVTFTVPAVS